MKEEISDLCSQVDMLENTFWPMNLFNKLDIMYTWGYTLAVDIIEREIKMLTLEDGKCPFQEWYDSIKDAKTLAVIEARITRVEAGNLSACKPVEPASKGVNELVIDFGPGYRIYFAEVGRVIIVLLGGGDKSTQTRDIKKAQKLWEDYADDPERFQRDLRG